MNTTNCTLVEIKNELKEVKKECRTFRNEIVFLRDHNGKRKKDLENKTEEQMKENNNNRTAKLKIKSTVDRNTNWKRSLKIAIKETNNQPDKTEKKSFVI